MNTLDAELEQMRTALKAARQHMKRLERDVAYYLECINGIKQEQHQRELMAKEH